MEKISNLISNKLEELRKKHYASLKKYHDECAKYENPDARHAAWFNKSEGKLHLSDGYNCDKCKNRGGFMKITELGNEVFVPCSCSNAREMVRKLKRAGIPNKLDDYTFFNYFHEKDWQKKLKNVIKKFGEQESYRWLYVCGQSGIGKTHLCTALINVILKKGLSVYYMPWRDEISELKNSMYTSGGEAIRRMKTFDVLYIDDLFKSSKDQKGNTLLPTSFEINTVYEVLNARYAGNKITIMSSNLKLEDIYNIDSAIAERIKNMCGINKYYIQVKYLPEYDSKNRINDLIEEIE